MNIEQAKEILEKVKISTSINATPIISIDELQDSLDIAIASLEAWDKVIDELEEYKITGSQMECFGTTEKNAKEYIPIDTALDIINKHLKEVEE